MFLQDIREIGVPYIDNIEANHLDYRAQLKDDLRKRFRTEYLEQLLLNKARSYTRTLKVVEIVLIANDCFKILDWPLARVSIPIGK